MAFRLYPQFQTFFGELGQLLAGGQLRFFEDDTVTPKDVFGDQALTVNNGTTVTLDSSGRPDVQIWGTGEYFVEVYDSLGVKQGEDIAVESGAGGASIPALVNGYFLTNDGAILQWGAVRQVPDPSGNSGRVLGTDGTVLIWQASQTGSTMKHQEVTAATTTTIDLALGTNILLNHGVDITTLAFTNPPSTTAAYIVSITRVKDASGTARAISNLSSVATFPGGVPTLTQTTGAIDVLALKFEPSVAKARGSYMLNLS